MKTKVLSAERSEKDALFCWIEEAGRYKGVVINNRDEVRETKSVLMSDYKDYDQFWQIMGKFNPYTDFFIHPRFITLSYKSVRRLISNK